MKKILTVLALALSPVAAFAWAPYEASSASQYENATSETQTVAAYDPATIPLDYYDANESEESAAEPLTLDAD